MSKATHIKSITKILTSLDVKYLSIEYEEGYNIHIYHVFLSAAERIQKLTKHEEEIGLALRGPVAISLDYDQGSVAIEVPKKKREVVRFDEIVQSASFKTNNCALPIVVGKDKHAKPYIIDLADSPHILISGTTGSGKSTLIHSAIHSLLRDSKNDKIFILIDPKQVELNPYAKLSQVRFVDQMDDALRVLDGLFDEINFRYKKFQDAKTKDIVGYNDSRIISNLPYIIVVIDEYADLVLRDKSVHKKITLIAQKGRAAGLHIILATQRPSADVLVGIIKSNFVTRIALKVPQKTDSRVILDENGAERLIGKGDLLHKSASGGIERVQGAYVSEYTMRDAISLSKKNTYRLHMKTLKRSSSGSELVPNDAYKAFLRILMKQNIRTVTMRNIKAATRKAHRSVNKDTIMTWDHTQAMVARLILDGKLVRTNRSNYYSFVG